MSTGNGSDPEARSPSFFKVIRDPSSPLSLPKAFVRRYFEKIPKNPILVSVTGKHSWRVEFEKIGEEYCFGNGWEKLVEDVGLCMRDVVIFWMIDALKFCVSFLGVNGCEKDLPVNRINNGIRVDDGNDDGQNVNMAHECHDDEAMAENNLCYKKVFRETWKYCMRMPAKFVKAAGLEDAKSITLKDPEGKAWTIGIHVERPKTRTNNIHRLTAGWSMYRKYHMLSDGDECTFAYDKQEGVLNLTHVLKCKRPIKQEATLEEVNTCYGGGNFKIGDKWSPIGGGGGGVGGVKVKVEYEPGPETVLVNGMSGKPALKTFVDVKIEDGLEPETVAGKRKREVPPPPPEKPSMGGGVEVNNEPLMGEMFRCKRVVYF